MDRLASLVIDGYDAEKSKIPRCNASSCGAEVGVYLEESGTLDLRLTSQLCDRSFADPLNEMEKESWSDYRWKKHRQSLMGETPAVRVEQAGETPAFPLTKTALAHQLRKEALGLVEELAERKSMRTVRRSSKEEKEAQRRHLRVVENF